jgi:mono/diheme cytochrome c family protein
MTDHTKRDQAARRELPDPEEASNRWPPWLWLFVGSMLGWGATYFILQSGSGRIEGGDQRTPFEAKVASQESAVDGAQVYQANCASCHQAQGEGLPGAFPPLAASEWVIGEARIPVKILLKGLTGPITVKGQSYNGVMPSFEAVLNDAEIAAVVTYIRSHWGNQVNEVGESQVKALREELKGRSQPWTADELK